MALTIALTVTAVSLAATVTISSGLVAVPSNGNRRARQSRPSFLLHYTPNPAASKTDALCYDAN